MDPVTLSLGAKALSLGKRFLPHILAGVALLGAVWLVHDRISDAEARASVAEAQAATAKASADQWRLASQTQSQSILRLADSYKTLTRDMAQRDERFREVWRETERAASSMEDRARRLLAIPAASPDRACAVALEALRDTRGYRYEVSAPIRPLRIELPPAAPTEENTDAH